MKGPGSLLAAMQAQIGTAGFAQILDSVAEAITIRDPEHRILYANRAAVASLGFSSLDELLAQSAGSIFDEYVVEDEEGRRLTMDDLPSVRLLSAGGADPLVLRTTHRRTGEVRWQLLKSAPLCEPDGTMVAAVTVIEDITPRKQAELRERFLSRATATLFSSLDYQETLGHVAWLIVPELADWCAIDLLDEKGDRLQVAVAHRDPAKAELAAELARLRPVRLDPRTGVGKAIRSGRSELYPVVTEKMVAGSVGEGDYGQLLAEVGMVSLMICPLRARGRTFGALTLISAESLRRFDERDRSFVEEVAARAAVAVDNARLATERRDVAITLQQSLLPDRVPAIPGWNVAAMYRAGAVGEEIEVGGDFYDFFQTPAGWLALLGDVTGKGVHAASMTSLVRHGARFLAKQHPDPSTIFVGLDEALRERGGLSLCTAVCVRLEEAAVVISAAGHPPPLIVRDDGRLRELGVSGDILGAWTGGRWESVRAELAPSETLILYTDGVTDAPGPRDRFGLRRLRRFLREHADQSPQALVGALGAELERYRAGGQADDTAIIALRPG
jgi:PAS domain S-box-containing protein